LIGVRLDAAASVDGAVVADYDHVQPKEPWRRDTMSNVVVNPLATATPPSH